MRVNNRYLFFSAINQLTIVFQLGLNVITQQIIWKTVNGFGDTQAHGSASRYAVDATNRWVYEYSPTDLSRRIRPLD